MRWALINADNVVTGVIVWNGEAEYTPADGLTLINVDDVPCGPGWTYNGSTFTAPPTEEQDDA